jgi:hypothetical protein
MDKRRICIYGVWEVIDGLRWKRELLGNFSEMDGAWIFWKCLRLI